MTTITICSRTSYSLKLLLHPFSVREDTFSWLPQKFILDVHRHQQPLNLEPGQLYSTYCADILMLLILYSPHPTFCTFLSHTSPCRSPLCEHSGQETVNILAKMSISMLSADEQTEVTWPLSNRMNIHKHIWPKSK